MTSMQAWRAQVLALQIAVAVAALVPLGAGLAGVLMGPEMVGVVGSPSSLGSHFRYLSGLLLGIGVAFWCIVPGIERHSGPFRLLTGLVIVGGLARLYGVLASGVPPAPMVFGLAMELVVTPLLCAWQGAIARRSVAIETSARTGSR